MKGKKKKKKKCNKLSCNQSFPCLLCLCDTLAWQLVILYSILGGFFPPYNFLFTQAPILVWLDGTIIIINSTIIDIISTILVTTGMYYSGYVGL